MNSGDNGGANHGTVGAGGSAGTGSAGKTVAGPSASDRSMIRASAALAVHARAPLFSAAR